MSYCKENLILCFSKNSAAFVWKPSSRNCFSSKTSCNFYSCSFKCTKVEAKFMMVLLGQLRVSTSFRVSEANVNLETSPQPDQVPGLFHKVISDDPMVLNPNITLLVLLKWDSLKAVDGLIYKTLLTLWVAGYVLTYKMFVHTCLHTQFFSQVACVTVKVRIWKREGKWKREKWVKDNAECIKEAVLE